MEFPAEVAGLLGRLREQLAARADVIGVYVYGSLMTGDYSPAASDIDVVALVRHEPDEAMTRELHEAVAKTGGPVGQLHCLYVAADHASDPERLCTYWFGDRMTQWDPVPLAALQAAVYTESVDYWRQVSRKRKLWLQDTWGRPRPADVGRHDHRGRGDQAPARLRDPGRPDP